jgi:hypothetical protein
MLSEFNEDFVNSLNSLNSYPQRILAKGKLHLISNYNTLLVINKTAVNINDKIWRVRFVTV